MDGTRRRGLPLYATGLCNPYRCGWLASNEFSKPFCSNPRQLINGMVGLLISHLVLQLPDTPRCHWKSFSSLAMIKNLFQQLLEVLEMYLRPEIPFCSIPHPIQFGTWPKCMKYIFLRCWTPVIVMISKHLSMNQIAFCW